MKYLTLIAILVSAISFQSVCSAGVTTEKNGIVLKVKISQDGTNNLVKCKLTNKSEFPLCTSSIRYRQVFYATLTDERGNELPHDEKWAQKYAQKTSSIYKRPRSHTGFQVNPGESVELNFFLEDAYPAAALDHADKLEISWESKYFGTETDFDGNPYHFPPDWKTSVSMPMEDVGIGAISVKEDQRNKVREQQKITEETALNHAVSPSVHREIVEQKTSGSNLNLFLWVFIGMFLVAIILIIIFLKQRRSRNPSD